VLQEAAGLLSSDFPRVVYPIGTTPSAFLLLPLSVSSYWIIRSRWADKVGEELSARSNVELKVGILLHHRLDK
jgi:hypothetical protein